MRRLIVMSVGILSLYITDCARAEGQGDLTLTLAGGREQSTLNWNIADADGSPNVLSELEFKDQSARRLQAELALVVNTGRFAGLTVRLEGHAIQVRDGRVRDQDWALNDRQGLFSESRSALTGDRGRGGRVLVGYRFKMQPVVLTPLLGWQESGRRLRIRDGEQVVGRADLTGLDSTYNTRWQGPWLGLGAQLRRGRLRLSALAGALYGHYKGEGDWNLRSDLAHPVSYRQTSDAAWLSEARLDLTWQHPAGWRAGVQAGVSTGKVRNGEDRLYFADGTDITSPLNAVNSHTHWWMLTAGWQWH